MVGVGPVVSGGLPPILMYHRIAAPPKGSTCRGLYVRPAVFDRQLRYLGALGYTFHTFADLEPVVARPLGTKPVLLTFDDGHLDNYTAALPILKRHGAVATIFVLSAEMGRRRVVWEEATERSPTDLLTWEQARELAQEGIRIESHGMTHRRLDRLSPREVDRQLRESRATIEEEVGVPPGAFCYPYGAGFPNQRQRLSEAGYRYACTTLPGLNPPGVWEPFGLRRIAVRGYRWIHEWKFRRLAGRGFR
jgi:peptidoglycan/xylan/chitin deacetylase (PgdA/CDA1 family)